MYQKIRITVVSLVVMSVCILSSVMTLSYFTDTDTSSNEFTVGNASTSLAIYDDISGETKRVFDAANYSPLVDRDIPFYLQATNDGNIPVYQRFRVVIPTALASVVTLSLPTNTNYTVTSAQSANNAYFVYYITNSNQLAVGATTNDWPTESKLVISGLNDTNKSLFACSDSSNNNCVFGINIYSDAVQTTGFADEAAAFADFTETYNN